MTDKIVVNYEFKDDTKLGGDTTEIPRTFTVAQFKNHIKGKYTDKINLDDFQVEYNNVPQLSTKKFSEFWSDDPVKDLYLVSQPNLANSSYQKQDLIDVDYQFLDNPQLGGDTVEIPRPYTVGDFKNRVKNKYKNLNLDEYHLVYNTAIQPKSKKFSDFWSDDPVREVHFVKDALSAFEMRSLRNIEIL